MYNEYSLDCHANLIVTRDPVTNEFNMVITCKKTRETLVTCGIVQDKKYYPFDGDIQYMLDCMFNYTDRCDLVYPNLLQHLCQLSDEQLCDVDSMATRVKKFVRNLSRKLEREINKQVKMQLDDNAELEIEPYVE